MTPPAADARHQEQTDMTDQTPRPRMPSTPAEQAAHAAALVAEFLQSPILGEADRIDLMQLQEAIATLTQLHTNLQASAAPAFTVKITGMDAPNPPSKLADAELHFTAGALEGLKLIGFSIWERRSGQRNVTFPARTYSINGERRAFALLRPAVADMTGQDRIRELILQAYQEYEDQQAAPVTNQDGLRF
jgi:hypothetical protein